MLWKVLLCEACRKLGPIVLELTALYLVDKTLTKKREAERVAANNAGSLLGLGKFRDFEQGRPIGQGVQITSEDVASIVRGW